MTVLTEAPWQVLYEDLTWRRSITHTWDELPQDGVMGLKVNGRSFSAMQHYFRGLDSSGQPVIGFSNDPPTDIQLRFQNARVLRGKTTTTRRYHECEVALGLWARENKKHEPFDGWVKDVIGWRLWTSNKVFDSKGVPMESWQDHWNSLPTDDVQFIMLYENWENAPGRPYRQVLSGSDVYYMAPGPEGRWIIGGTASQDDPEEVPVRYSGAAIKRGKFMNVSRLNQLQQEVMASAVL